MRAAVRPIGRALLVDDAYNSNPGSARAALALLDDAGGARPRVIVLGTMRELGAAAPAQHEAIARAALAAGAAVVAGIGDFAAPLAASGDPRVVVADDVDALWAALAPRLPDDAAILLKASRGVRLERLVPRLEAWAAERG
jgi:UDP-N-acetylmuramoyl-tripeptide--D-alanyl-D-alanine ligase